MSTNKTPTPRTDEQAFHESCNFDVPWQEFAEQLETELTAATKERDALRKQVSELREVANLNPWREGPHRGGGGTAESYNGNAMWNDGDSLLIAVELSSGVIEMYIVSVFTDEGWGEMKDQNGDSFDAWTFDDISWWKYATAKELGLPPSTAPQAAAATEDGK